MPLHGNHMFFGLADKLTDEQREYVNAILDHKMVFCNSKSGTGKTTLAVGCAKLLQRELVYIFSPVEEKKLGFTPGDVFEKESKYLTPLKDALLEINEDPTKAIISDDNIMNVKNGNAWVRPMSHVFARGINLKGKTIIIDEAQNFTRGDLKKILTRIHDDCTVVVIGHDGQCDLDKPEKSGFIPYLEHFKNEPYVKICNLTKNFRGNLAQKADELVW
jgi:phosphate starvation-inducible protein PhoH